MALLINPRTDAKVSTRGYKFTWTLEESYDSLVEERHTSPQFQACGHTWLLALKNSTVKPELLALFLTCEDITGDMNVTCIMSTGSEKTKVHNRFDNHCHTHGAALVSKKTLKQTLEDEKKLVITATLFVQHVNDVGVQMAKDFRKLLFSESSSDIKFVFGEEHLPGHSFIIAARSPVFAAMLNGSMLESKTKEVVIADICKTVFAVLLEYVYTDNVSSKNLELYKYDLLMLADKYNLPGLATICEYFLLESVHLKNACKIFLWVDKYNMPLVRAAVLGFIVANSSEIFKSEGYGRLMLENTKLALEIQQLLVKPDEERARKNVKLE